MLVSVSKSVCCLFVDYHLDLRTDRVMCCNRCSWEQLQLVVVIGMGCKAAFQPWPFEGARPWERVESTRRGEEPDGSDPSKEAPGGSRRTTEEEEEEEVFGRLRISTKRNGEREPLFIAWSTLITFKGFKSSSWLPSISHLIRSSQYKSNFEI